ncbi:hypothetical protein AB0L40_04605 [Patulibacter sp. NPDC049589]|uniref:hypothetical protein n=1 Tax=Patulibacter sp. NPDC049589 TaxID=3154731 RepID=UPI003427810E
MSGTAPGPIEARGPLVGWVCGYGSLARLVAPMRFSGLEVDPVWGLLRGHVRDWGVAMANRAPESDPKHYVRSDTGRRFAGFVAFLDVVPTTGGDPVRPVGALAVPVDARRLAALDAREVNYERHDVTAEFTTVHGAALGPRVWAFRGTAGARERARIGAADGTLVIGASYARDVEAAFAGRPAAVPSFAATTQPFAGPEVDLQVVADPSLLGY